MRKRSLPLTWPPKAWSSEPLPDPMTAVGQGVPGGRRWVRNRVLGLLVIGAIGAALSLAFVTVAPNRLVSGSAVPLQSLMVAAPWGLWAAATVLVVAVFMPATQLTQVAVALAAALLFAGLAGLAGSEAARRSAGLPALARVSLGGGFWLMLLMAWLAFADALQRLDLSLGWRSLAHVALLVPLVWLVGAGALDQLSLLKEYANRDETFHAAGLRHLQIVLAALAPSLLIGLPLGVAAARSDRVAKPLLALLNLVQTMPSIALFALLIGPLSALAAALPGWGLSGIGLLPAAVALTLYALLPIVHGMSSGLRQVPAAVLAAAAGMGMTPRQRLWRVELPLALPVLLSALRVTTVQVIGLAVVAALIGAGGFGALVFQGLASSAIDLVLLGVLPVLALAAVADAGFALLIVALAGPQR